MTFFCDHPCPDELAVRKSRGQWYGLSWSVVNDSAIFKALHLLCTLPVKLSYTGRPYTYVSRTVGQPIVFILEQLLGGLDGNLK